MQIPRKSLQDVSGQEKAKKCESKENAGGVPPGQPVETIKLKLENQKNARVS